MNSDLALVLDDVLKSGFQIHPDAIEILREVDSKRMRVVVREIVREKSRSGLFYIGLDDLEARLGLREDPGLQTEIRVRLDPTPKTTTAEGVEGYSALFASRFTKLKRIIADRPEAKKLKTVSSVKATKSEKGDDLYVCGLVSSRTTDKNVTKLILEDPTGSFEGLVFDNDLQKVANTLLTDQLVMACVGRNRKSGFVIKNLILPGIPDRRVGKAESETYAVFLSDLHVGSKYFMEKEFTEFVSWLAGPDPIARRVRFVLVCGDVVDGVGIYPNQNKELVYPTIEEQLGKVEELFSKIPNNVKIVVAPGNHDPGRRALPQPAIPKKYNAGLWERDNVIMVGNPAVVSLDGVVVTMFHGQSIDDIVKTTPGLSYDKPVDVMKTLLKARHLSPIYGNQTPIAPEQEDLLVIEDIPDIFHVGHVHKAQLGMYKGILLINSGSWQRQTPFQASVGMVPNPGIALVVNLQTQRVLHQNYNPNLENALEA